MIYVGIDVAKNKHDCCITGDNGGKLYSVFTIKNNREGFDVFLEKILSVATNLSEVKAGLEATGHYHINILRFLIDNEINTYLINPLRTNSYRKSHTLRSTKTDKEDAATIADMLKNDDTLIPYTSESMKYDELRALTRYRYDKVRERARLRIAVVKLTDILFPELEDLVSDMHGSFVYALLSEYPGASYIAKANVESLTEIISASSCGKCGEERASLIRDAALNSVGSEIPARSMELKHTITLIGVLTEEINGIEKEINEIMDRIDPPILSIPGVGIQMGAMIIAEVGDFSRFKSADALLAYAGLSPTTYQSGKLLSTHSHMEKRGSKYLRYALFSTAKYVCRWDEDFARYLAGKRAEGKHYNVAITHAARRLLRVIYRMQLSGEPYRAKY